MSESDTPTFEDDYVQSSCLSKLFLNWSISIMSYINKHKSLDDASQCPKMPEEVNSEHVVTKMEQALDKMVKKNPDFDYKNQMLYLLLRTFKWQISTVVFWGLMAEMVAITNLFFSSFFVKWLEEDGDEWAGYLYALGFVCLVYISQLFRVQYFFGANALGINVRKAASGIMYKKSLRLSQKSKAVSSTGKIVTIVSSELQTLDWGIQFSAFIIIGPISSTYGFCLIAINFQEGAAIGFLVFILMVVVQVLLSKCSLKWKRKEGAYSDKRIDVLGDSVNGIRTIKTYGWESPFEKLVKKFRNLQLKMIFNSHVINSIGHGIFQNGGFLIAIFIFSYHYLMDREFSYSRSLSTIGILGYLSQFGCYLLFTAINAMTNLKAIIQRAGEVIGMSEFSHESNQDDQSLPTGTRVCIENASLSWGFQIKKEKGDKFKVDQDHKDVNLSNISFQAYDGNLKVVVGSVGCGKSTFLASIMHELEVIEGEVKTNGNKAYVEQEPFIISGTVKENILFGNDFDQELFKQTIRVCCLEEDLKQMANGADTIIGERGINVSGGQKARLSLARAIYSQADIYLLDDPLSAVDPEVASKIFFGCINDYLKDKCVILVTHQVQFLKDVEDIILIDDNTIKLRGSYDDLKEQGMDFDKLLESYEDKKDKPAEDEIIFDEEDDDNRLPPIRHQTEPENDPIHNSISKVKDELSNADDCSNEIMKNKNTITKEVVDKGELKIKDWWNFYKYGTGVIGFFLIIFSTILGSFLFISISYIVGEWTRKDKKDQQDSGYIHLFYGSILVYFLVIFIRAMMVTVSCLVASKNIHEKMVYKVLRAPIKFFDATPIGRILTRLAQDIAAYDFILPMTMNFVLNNGFRALSILILMIITVPFVAVPAIFALLMMYLIRKRTILPQNDLKRYDSVTKAPINTKFGSVLDGVTSIRAYKKEDYFIKNFMIDSDLNTNVLFTYQGVVRWAHSRLDMTSISLLLVNSLIIVILKNHTDWIDVVFASISLQLSMEYAIVCAYLIRLIGELESYMTRSQRAVEYAEMETEDELEKPNDPKHWPETPEIVFNDVVMRYREGLEPVLKGVNTIIKPGEKVGIIGRTGAGKSSIVQVIFRLIEMEPQSRLLISGDDIRDLGLHCLRLNISFIPQTPFLMASNIRDNLDPFKIYSDEEIWKTLEEVQLKQYVESLDHGLDTEISDNNVVFSVGQKQLICLARAILRKNKILILDEATANVDIETDRMIQQTIREKFKDCTMLTIAHRMATIADSDKILVMKDGIIKEEGKPNEILRKLSRNHTDK